MFPRALATQGCRLPARGVTYKHPDAPSRHFFAKTGLQANGKFCPTVPNRLDPGAEAALRPRPLG